MKVCGVMCQNEVKASVFTHSIGSDFDFDRDLCSLNIQIRQIKDAAWGVMGASFTEKTSQMSIFTS